MSGGNVDADDLFHGRGSARVLTIIVPKLARVPHELIVDVHIRHLAIPCVDLHKVKRHTHLRVCRERLERLLDLRARAQHRIPAEHATKRAAAGHGVGASPRVLGAGESVVEGVGPHAGR